MTRRSTVREIQDATKAAGGTMIGAIVYWSLSKIRIKADKLAEMYDKRGLDRKWMPPKIKSSATFRKAIREVARKTKAFIRLIDETNTEIIYGVVDETRDREAQTLSYDVPTQVIFSKAKEIVKLRGKVHPDATKIKEVFSKLDNRYVTRDLMLMLTTNLHRKIGSLLLREAGGIYFAPVTRMDIVEKHQAIVEDLGCEFYTIPIYGDAVSKRNLGKQTKRALGEELQTLREELESFKTDPPRRDTLTRRLDEFKALKAKAGMYAELLSVRVNDIKEGIDDATMVMRGILADVEDNLAKKKAATNKGKYRRNEGLADVRKMKRIEL